MARPLAGLDELAKIFDGLKAALLQGFADPVVKDRPNALGIRPY